MNDGEHRDHREHRDRRAPRSGRPGPRDPLLFWRTLRRETVVSFTRRMALRHPELRRVVTWPAFVRMAEREGVSVRVLPLSRDGRLLRLGQHVGIQINQALDRTLRTRTGMHELCHLWRDDPGMPCYHAASEDEQVLHPSEEFAEIFAWAVTSPARVHLKGLREEDL